ncbi:DUF4157 domain-containing protein [Leptobacterium flavescens]|uniref:DUF4157 domain-containing protein n=1 Tax=Leptobacterium flavescens TaxID=472055 RepID=A0A6P0UFM4_9FLAO|nr:DUF4157 domain-containing protein [Leptobacterium flavescens]NER12064.1 DUF4157 domain-containing protein [Leptobacterium flavescens]
MKTAEAEKSTHAQKQTLKEQQPFFNKEGGDGDFFSKTNGATQNFFAAAGIQPKLTVGRPNDKYEIEADMMADKVVQHLSNDNDRNIPSGSATNLSVQQKCSSCEKEEKLQEKKEDDLEGQLPDINRKPIFESNAEQPETELQTKSLNVPPLQTKCAACEEKERIQEKKEELAENELDIQTKEEGSGAEQPSNLENRLNSSKGKGSPMSKDTQDSMGSAFSADFSNVRIHTGTEAVKMNRELGAQAFTHGNDIYFNQGKYDTNSSSGKHLLAHELTHTIQQGKSVQTKKQTDTDKENYSTDAPPNVQAAWYNFDIPFTDYQFDPSLRGIKNAANITVGAAKDAAGWVGDQAKAIFNKIKKLINKGKDWIKKKWNALKNMATGGFNAAKILFDMIIHFVKSPLGFISSAIINMDPETIRTSWGSFTTFVLSIWDNFHKMGTGLMKSIQKVWGTISGYADSLFDKISSLTNSRLFKLLPGPLKSVITGLIDSVRSLWNGIKSAWNIIFNKVKTFVDNAFKKIKTFIKRILSFAIDTVISGIIHFGKALLFIRDFLKSPMKYLRPLAGKIAGFLKGVDAHFKGQIDKYFGNGSENATPATGQKAAPAGTAEGVIQKKPLPGSKKDSATWSEIGSGVWDIMKKKWEEVKKDPLSIVLNLLLDMVLPIIGNVKDVIKLFKDIKKIVTKPLGAGSLEEFWTSLLHILDIPILIYNTFWSIIGRSLMLPLLIASFIPHPVVKGIAVAAGYALLGAMITGETANIGHKLLLLKTGATDDEEKKDAFNSLSDSLIAFAMEIALAILILVVSAIANVIKGIFGFVKGKVFRPKTKPPAKSKPDVDGGKKGDGPDSDKKKSVPDEKKKIELPEDIAGVCRIGSINCTKLPDKIVAEVPAYPTPPGHSVPFPGGPYKIRKSALSGVSRNTKTLQKIVLENPGSWSTAFRKALNKANGGKAKVDAAINNNKTTDLKWPVENGEAWQVHHNKPVSYGGGNGIGNLIPLPATVHRLFTSWWTKVQNRFKARFTDAEWADLMKDVTSIPGSKAAAKAPK